ncbi:MAG: hypothetical protein HZA20_12335 [Nitrospirae bacterium]|nr:hypothetical protein [Nitrospirota bacterium]
MTITIEKRLDSLISDAHEIQKELILARMRRLKTSGRRQAAWQALAEKISAQWDSVSAVDEIAAQREKAW